MDDCELPTSMIDDGVADTSSKKRPRKKHLYSQILKQMEFYFSDANLRRDRFLSQLVKSNKYVSLDVFLRFNKIRAMTNDIKEIVKALGSSELLKISEDGKSVYRTSEIQEKANGDDCMIYVEQLPPDANHEWVSGIFSAYGKVEYVSIPKYKNRAAIKGFAFVEFDTPEAANKALKAFGSAGCCLPPQMRPEELCSIASYREEENTEEAQEKNESLEPIEETVGKLRKKSIENENGSKTLTGSEQKWEEELCEPKSKKMKLDHVTNEKSNKKGKSDEDNFEEDLSVNIDESVAEGFLSKQKKKRKLIVEDECETENPNQEVEVDRDDYGKKEKKMCDNKAEDIRNEESMQGDHLEKKKNHKQNLQECVNDTKRYCEEMEQGNEDTSDPHHMKRKKKKRKHDVDVSGESEDADNDEGTKEQKMSDQEEEVETTDDLSSKKKRSRKRNKSKKKKEADHTHGLKIISRSEWCRLRNKYLNLQRQKMQALKQNLARKKFGSNYQSPYPSQESVGKEGKSEQDVKTYQKMEPQKTVFMPGVVIKITLSEPLQDVRSFKNNAKVHHEVKFVDAHEGQSEVFIRCASTDAVQKFMSEQMWENMSVLKGDAEDAYWQKIWKDREEKCQNKTRTNIRGRDKLLKRAERELGKHIKFDD